MAGWQSYQKHDTPVKHAPNFAKGKNTLSARFLTVFSNRKNFFSLVNQWLQNYFSKLRFFFFQFCKMPLGWCLNLKSIMQHATPAALFSVCSDCELDGKIIANPAAHGFALDHHGLWCKGKFDLAEKIERFRVVWDSVDSYGKPNTRNFKTPAAMLKFAEQEQFLTNGGISEDGVTRFLGFQGNPFPNGAPSSWREIPLSALRPA